MPVYSLGNYAVVVTPMYIQVSSRVPANLFYRLPILDDEHLEYTEVDENEFMFETATHRIHAKFMAQNNDGPERVQLELQQLHGEDFPTVLVLDRQLPERVFKALRAIGREEAVDADPAINEEAVVGGYRRRRKTRKQKRKQQRRTRRH